MDQTISHRPPPAPAASALLEDLVEAFPNEKISVGELLDRLDSRAHGVLMLILSLPMLIPNIPGISTIFGVLMLPPALALMLGQRRMWMPEKVRAWTFDRSGFNKALKVAIPALKRVEFLIKPRISFLTRWPATSYVGFQTLIMGLVLILPIWGANLSPGVTVTFTALALLQRDGLLMLLSVPCAVGSVAWVFYFTKYGIQGAEWLAERAQHLLQLWF